MNNTLLQLKKNSNDFVMNNSNLIFDEITEFQGNIDYEIETGIITIYDSGLYIIDWFVSTQTTSTSPSIIFRLNSDTGDSFYSNSINRSSSISGTAIIKIEDVPKEISLINESNAQVFFSSAINTKATLRIVSLNDISAINDSCYPLNQYGNLMDQLATIYQGAEITIFQTALATLSGILDSVYISPDAGNVPLLIIDSGGTKLAININKITALYFPNSIYDNSIIYLDPPDPNTKICTTDLLKNVHDYISVGDGVSVSLGINTSASGDVTVNEYGIIVFADITSIIFIMVNQLNYIYITSQNTLNKNINNKNNITIENN